MVLGLLRDEENRTAALAPAPRLVDLKELAETVRASGTPVELRMSGTDRQLSPALELSIYRVVQEALTNVVKHAPGARAAVDLAVSDQEVRLEVTDDGGPAGRRRGDRRAAGSGPGHGIVGMRERIGAFGGWLVAEPLAGRGFRVLAEVPIEGCGVTTRRPGRRRPGAAAHRVLVADRRRGRPGGRRRGGRRPAGGRARGAASRRTSSSWTSGCR